MDRIQFVPSREPHLRNTTLFITGASRGIGRAIALRAAQDGANVVLVAKTVDPHPKLPGTIFTVAEEVTKMGGRALPIACDIRDEVKIEEAVQRAVQEFGGIDIVVNNASAIRLTGTIGTTMKHYDLMHQINVRGTFAVSRATLPHLLKSKNPHILMLSPPLDMRARWFGPHMAYTMSKFGMSMVVLGLAEEFKSQGIAVNALWPKTIISTSALQAFAGDQCTSIIPRVHQSIVGELYKRSRSVAIVADAAYAIFCQKATSFTGIFATDEAILKAQNIPDLSRYACDPKVKDPSPGTI